MMKLVSLFSGSIVLFRMRRVCACEVPLVAALFSRTTSAFLVACGLAAVSLNVAYPWMCRRACGFLMPRPTRKDFVSP